MFDGKRAAELYLAGRTDNEIAAELDRDATHVRQWRNRNHLAPNPQRAAASAKNRQAAPDGVGRSGRRNNTLACLDCRYWQNGSCDYLLVNHKRRPCPPGDGCTVREDREHWGCEAGKAGFERVYTRRKKEA